MTSFLLIKQKGFFFCSSIAHLTSNLTFDYRGLGHFTCCLCGRGWRILSSVNDCPTTPLLMQSSIGGKRHSLDASVTWMLPAVCIPKCFKYLYVGEWLSQAHLNNLCVVGHPSSSYLPICRCIQLQGFSFKLVSGFLNGLFFLGLFCKTDKAALSLQAPSQEPEYISQVRNAVSLISCAVCWSLTKQVKSWLRATAMP